MRKKNSAVFLCLLLIIILILSSCSGNETGDIQGKESEMIVGIPQDFDSLDPHISVASGTEEVMFNIFQGLVMPSPDGELVPALAENWEINDDSTSFTFYLRKDVVFHDGSDFTAADVKYTFDRVCGRIEGEPEAARSTFADVIADVEIIDDYTVVIKLNQSDARFISNMYWAIIPEGSGPVQSETPVGAGPYKFVSYTPGVGMVVQKNENYYEAGIPKIDRVEFRIFADMNAAVMALSNGEIQYMSITYDIVSQIPREAFVIEQYPMNTVQLMGLNNDFEPFRDKRVRQALNYAIDKEQVIKMLAPGAPEVDSNFSPVMGFWYEDLKDYYSHDIDKAKALLKEAGYPDLSFTVKVPSEYPIHVNAAQIIQQQYLEAGIDMKIEVIDWNTWLENVYGARKHEATIIGLTGKLDPDSILRRFASSYSKNFINFNNSKYDELINNGAMEPDPESRAEIYKEVQRILTEEAASVFIMDPINYVAVDADLKGFAYYPISFIDLRYFEYE